MKDKNYVAKESIHQISYFLQVINMSGVCMYGQGWIVHSNKDAHTIDL